MAHGMWTLASNHFPVDIIPGPIQIEHGARGVGNNQSRARQKCNLVGHLIHQAIFQPKAGKVCVAHRGKKRAGIGAPGMWHRNQHRQRRG